MDPNKLTQKVAEIVNAARDLALEEQQQQLSPLHLAAVMIEDQQGIAKQAILKASSDDAYRSLMRLVRKAIARLPKVEPPPDEIYLGADLKKAFSAATKLQKEKGDAFLGKFQSDHTLCYVVLCQINAFLGVAGSALPTAILDFSRTF